MTGLALETATEHVEVVVCGADDQVLAHEVEDVGHGHTRRLASLVARALERSGVAARDLAWVAADLGPGSFTGVRVGIATAQALAMAAGASLGGASSLASLAHGCEARRAVVVPLVPAGRRDVYAGFFRADARGAVRLIAAPLVGTAERVLDAAREAAEIVPKSALRFVGPAVPREREQLERAFPGSTSPAWREEGLSALDLARAARSGGGPAAGLPPPGAPPQPLYVRSAQAEERVRRKAQQAVPTTIRVFGIEDIPAVSAIERRVFSDPWPPSFFAGELANAMAWGRVAERGGRIAGYSVAWLGADGGHLGNLAVAPEQRRAGVARVLLEDLLERAVSLGVERIVLEVRVSNFPAQWLYKAYGFRLAGLRRRYYSDTGEDALVMEWRADRLSASAAGSRGGGRAGAAGMRPGAGGVT